MNEYRPCVCYFTTPDAAAVVSLCRVPICASTTLLVGATSSHHPDDNDFRSALDASSLACHESERRSIKTVFHGTSLASAMQIAMTRKLSVDAEGCMCRLRDGAARAALAPIAVGSEVTLARRYDNRGGGTMTHRASAGLRACARGTSG